MSDRVYFTQEEAKTLVGIKVEALAPFPSVPKGSIGEVVKALPYADHYFVVEVRWDVTRPRSFYNIMIWGLSFNVFRQRKHVIDDFCKSEFFELVQMSPKS